MGHATIRIREETRDTLRAIAAAVGKPMQALLEEAVEALRRLRFLQRVNASYEKLRHRPSAWQAMESERATWDDTLLDGLPVREAATPPAPNTKRRARRRRA